MMGVGEMNKDNGGPAFPNIGGHKFTSGNDVRVTLPHPGMTMRDYFAAKASDADVGEIMGQHFDFDTDEYTITRQQARYIHADFMLAERSK